MYLKKMLPLLVITMTLGLAAGIFRTRAAETDGVAYFGHEKVGTALAKGGILLTRSSYIVEGVHRDKAGQAEVHDKETDVIYIVDGTATFVTGGTMIGGKDTRPGQHLGTNIEGGEAHELSKGDVVVVPAGTPHWFKTVPTQVSYFVVKVVQP
jgi:mannose-6-phosphate isomerase-like protein (cupin superfamily)